jgi:hypothetical protein
MVVDRPFLVGADEGEELSSGGGVVAKLAVERRGDGGGPKGSNATHGHDANPSSATAR